MVNFQKAAKATGLEKKIPFYQHTAIELSTLEPQGRMPLKAFTVPPTTSSTILIPLKTRLLLRSLERPITAIRKWVPCMVMRQVSSLKRVFKRRVK